MSPEHQYDTELGQITDQDCEYACRLIFDIEAVDTLEEKLKLVAEWFRKVRYEAVLADRDKRPHNERELTREDVESGNYEGAGKYTCAARGTKCIWAYCEYECSGRVAGPTKTETQMKARLKETMNKRAGAEAWARRQSLSTNPYQQRSAKDAWRAGWIEARELAIENGTWRADWIIKEGNEDK